MENKRRLTIVSAGRVTGTLCVLVVRRAHITLENSLVAFPGGLEGKTSACNAGDPGSIPGSGRSPGEGNGNPLQYSPGKSHGRRSLIGYSPWGHEESDTTQLQQQIQLNIHLPCVGRYVCVSMYTSAHANSVVRACSSPQVQPCQCRRHGFSPDLGRFHIPKGK